MQLNFIKLESCPVCGCKIIISESIEADDDVRTHCNGENWEHREFLCGQEVIYIPNFSDIELSTTRVCRNNPEYKEKELKEERARKELLDFINKLDVPENKRMYWLCSI